LVFNGKKAIPAAGSCPKAKSAVKGFSEEAVSFGRSYPDKPMIKSSVAQSK
jgi:hypothetical protein